MLIYIQINGEGQASELDLRSIELSPFLVPGARMDLVLILSTVVKGAGKLLSLDHSSMRF